VRRTAAQRARLEALVEESDADGDGTHSLEEVEQLVQEVGELYLRVQREEENEYGRSLSFSRPEIYQLRSAYDILDSDNSNGLEPQEVHRAVKLLHFRINLQTLRRLLAQVDDDHTGELSFKQFLTLIRLIEDETKDQPDGRLFFKKSSESAEDRPREPTPPTAHVESSAGEQGHQHQQQQQQRETAEHHAQQQHNELHGIGRSSLTSHIASMAERLNRSVNMSLFGEEVAPSHRTSDDGAGNGGSGPLPRGSAAVAAAALSGRIVKPHRPRH